ncbi:MAG: endonuclease domain-containing protein [Betaproteobacteria bacterium]|jgi:very-short-patch-repair endonuclease|nr:endonuclease domain-containing protein [Betaproteobacteria bacterium]
MIPPKHNAPELKSRRRELRASLTPAESLLWHHLQRSKLQGRKFRRQHSVGPYVLDFYCPSERLAIELDGAAHDHELPGRRDVLRTTYLATTGVRVIRFENQDVVRNPEGVLESITRCFGSPLGRAHVLPDD